MKNDIKTLEASFSPFGCLDLKRCCEIGDEVWTDEHRIVEIIHEFMSDCWLTKYEDVDPVYCLMDHALQVARNEIEAATGYDFVNDCSPAAWEIYTHWNYMCSGYCYSDEAISELKEKVAPYFHSLNEKAECSYFFRQLDIGT